jgi:hypothetical protein
MKLQAKQRLMATTVTAAAMLTAAPLTEKSVETFLETIGVPSHDMIDLSDDKRYWIVYGVYETGDMIKTLGKPVISPNSSQYSLAVWNLKGKGAVIHDMNAGELYVVNANGPSLLGIVFECFSDDARYKSYEVDKKSKTITYQPYSRRGTRLAKSMIQKIAKAFGMGDWNIVMETGHWS